LLIFEQDYSHSPVAEKIKPAIVGFADIPLTKMRNQHSRIGNNFSNNIQYQF